MLKCYDAGLSIFTEVIDSKLTAWAKEARKSLVAEVIPKLDKIHTFLSVDTSSIQGYRIGVVGVCKNKDENTTECEFSITFENIEDGSNLIVEMSTLKGYADQSGFSDSLTIFNTDKWLRFITSQLVNYKPTFDNTLGRSGTATINKVL